MHELLDQFKRGTTDNPKISDKFIFLDDGKWGGSRLHVAFVINIFNFKELGCVSINRPTTSYDGKTYTETLTIQQAIQQNIDNDFDDSPIYTKHPRQVLQLYIPTYDNNLIYAIRTSDSDYDWFSCDINSYWQSGGLLSYDEYEVRRGNYNYSVEMIEDKFSELLESDNESDREHYIEIKTYLESLI